MVALAACGSDAPSGPSGPPIPTTPMGSYTIQTVNGKTLPVAVAADGSYSYEVTVGTLALGADGTYSVVTTYRQTLPQSVETFVDSTGGVWTQSGSAIQLTNALDGSKDAAVWDKGLLTFAETNGTTTNTFVYYQKR